MNKLRTTLGVTALLAASGGSLAWAHANDSALAKLPKEIQPMHCLVGTWQGTASFSQGETKAAIKLRMTCEPTSSGFGVSCKSSLDGVPGGKAEETDLFGYDPGNNQYHWFAVTSMGETHDHVAEAPKGPTIEFVYRGQQDGKAMVEAIKLTLSDDGKHMELRNDGTIDGRPAWSMSGSATKR